MCLPETTKVNENLVDRSKCVAIEVSPSRDSDCCLVAKGCVVIALHSLEQGLSANCNP